MTKIQKLITTLTTGAMLFGGLVLGLTPAHAAITEDTVGLPAVGKASGLNTNKSLQETAGGLINASLAILGTIIVGMLVYAGFLYVTAAGKEEQIGTAKKIIVACIIGVILIFAAFAIAKFVISTALKATGSDVAGANP